MPSPKDAPIDFLLLNFSNFPERPIYPYAFVQIGAQFRKNGLSFKAIDFLFEPPERWPELIQAVLDRYKPRCVGFHLRQVDSCDFRDYLAAARNKNGSCAAFEPVQWTKRAITIVRDHAPTTKTIVGGIGFSFQPIPLFDYLNPDFGMAGDVNSFAGAFDHILSGKSLKNVPNLIFRSENGEIIANKRAYFEGPDFAEYTPEVIADLRQFYARTTDQAASDIQIAVEIGRGCPYKCYFCGEPVAKGRRLSWRDLDVVRSELRFLIDQGFSRFWLVCSELNPKGDMHFKRVAEMMEELLQDQPKLEWSSYMLPYVDPDDLLYLYTTNYKLSNNEVLSLDQENLHAAKVPYTVEHAKRFMLMQAANAPVGQDKKITLFAGNTKIRPATLHKTAKFISEHRLYDNYDVCSVVYGSRIFRNAAETGHGNGTKGYYFRDGDILPTSVEAADVSRPTFILPDSVTAQLSDHEDVTNFYKFCGDYLFSRAYRRARPAESYFAWRVKHKLAPSSAGELARLGGTSCDQTAGRDACSTDIVETKSGLSRIQSEFAAELGLEVAVNGKPFFDNLAFYEAVFSRLPNASGIAQVVSAMPGLSATSRSYLSWLSYRHGLDLALQYQSLIQDQ